MSVDTARYSGRTLWIDGICWLVTREVIVESGRIDTETAHLKEMGRPRSMTMPWAEVESLFNQGLTSEDSRGKF